MEQLDVLQGFEPVDPDTVSGIVRRRGVLCGSRALLEAFVASGEVALSKPMEPAALEREAYNLRHYRKSHAAEFGDVGISARRGRLTLYRLT